MVKVIKAWIEDPERNYWDGIRLLEKYGSNLQLIYMLRRAHTQGNEERLAYELEKVVESAPEPEAPNSQFTSTATSREPAAETETSGKSEGSASTGEPEGDGTKDPDAGSEGSGSETSATLEGAAASGGQNPGGKENDPGTEATIGDRKRGNSDLLQGLLDQRAAKYAERNAISDTLADLDGEPLKEAAERVQKVDDEIIALTTQIQFVEKNGHLPVPVVNLEEDLEAFKKKKKSLGEKLSRIKADLKKTPGNLKKEAQAEDIKAQIAALDLKIKALTQTD